MTKKISKVTFHTFNSVYYVNALLHQPIKKKRLTEIRGNKDSAEKIQIFSLFSLNNKKIIKNEQQTNEKTDLKQFIVFDEPKCLTIYSGT